MINLRETDIARLLRAAGAPRGTAANWAPHYFEAMRDYGVHTAVEIAHFIAQTGHESAHFRTTTEYASGAAYEWRKDLGNVYKGDGRRFRGRGLIQLTGRANYTEFKRWLAKRGIDFDPVKNPKQVADMPWAMLATVFYWTERGVQDLARQGDHEYNVRMVTKRINGGYNGLRDRLQKFVRVMDVLNDYPGYDGPHVRVVFGAQNDEPPRPVLEDGQDGEQGVPGRVEDMERVDGLPPSPGTPPETDPGVMTPSAPPQKNLTLLERAFALFARFTGA